MAISILAGMALLGGGVQALGALQQGAEAKRTGRLNAALLRQDAQTVLDQTDAALFDLDRRATLLRGETIARAAGGGTTTSGSVAAVLAEQATSAAIDKLRLQFTAELQTSRLGLQARETKRGARVAQTESTLSAFGSLLGAGGTAAQIQGRVT